MKKIRLLIFIVSIFVLCNFTGAQAQGSNGDKIFGLDGTDYSIPCQTVSVPTGEDGNESERLFLIMGGEEAERLVSKAGRRFSWSASGSTLMVFSTSGQWTVSANSQEIIGPHKEVVKARGLMYTDSDLRLLEPQLFIQLLDLAADTEENRALAKTSLAHKIYAPVLKNDADGTKLTLGLDFRPRFKVVNSDSESVTLRFDNAVWGEEETQIHLGHVTVQAEQKKVNGTPSLTLTYKLPAHWSPIVRESFDNKSLSVVCSPQFSLSAAQNEPSALTCLESEAVSLEENSSEAEDILITSSDPFRYFWNYCADCRKLCLYLDNVDSDDTVKFPVESNKFFFKTEAAQVGSAQHPILRIDFLLTQNTAFSFPESQLNTTAAVRFFKGDLQAVAQNGTFSGKGHTLGFVDRRGVIVIDPGHGGGDPGCYSRRLGVYEKQITLDVAMRLRDLLESEGWEVVLTRDTDRDVSWLGSPDSVELQSRCDTANNIGADFFISLHCNASVSSIPNGSSVYWFKPEDRQLAKALEFSLSSLGFYQIGTLREGFYVLRNTEMPAVLVEMAYLTNYEDGTKLADQGCRQTIAEELAQALNDFIGQSEGGSSNISGRTVRSAP